MSATSLAILKSCPKCGSIVSSPGFEGICPRCLMRALFGDSLPAESATKTLAQERFFGDYELLEELGRGGSGIVFKARQLGVNRTVALKLLSGGSAAGRDFIHRFHTEAATTARLEHPSIVPIYEFGDHEGAHFLAMRWLEGGTLQTRNIDGAIPPRECAELMVAVAAAVEHAHRHGVLHRDLKPGNILLDAAGKPYVADFGLARLAEQESSLTLSHSVLGTIAYLAPEVARSGAAHATTASDIYGLGAVLYELLTRRPPFSGETIVSTLAQIETSEPAKPRTLNPEIPGDLETICLKCLEKDSAKRYPSAQALADDLERFLKNEPIAARPITRVARVIRWSQRNPALASAYSLLILLLLVILVASPLAVFRIDQARKAESAQRRLAEQNAYASDMLLAQAALQQSHPSEAFSVLEKYSAPQSRDLRGWEWRYYFGHARGNELFRLGQHATNNVVAAGFLTTNKAWSAGKDGAVRIWDVPNRREVQVLAHDQQIFDAASSPDGRWLVTITGIGLYPATHPVTLWNLNTGEAVAVLATNRFPRKATKFSSDSRFVAYEELNDGPEGIHIFDLASRRRIALLNANRNKISPLGLDFSPSEPLLAYGESRDGAIKLWNYETKTNAGTLIGHTDAVQALAFFPDGKRLASASLDKSLRIWNLASGTEILNIPAEEVLSLAISPQADLLAIVDETAEIKLLDARDGAFRRALRGIRGYAQAVAFSPDGQTLIGCGEDDAVRIWARDSEPLSDLAQKLPTGLIVSANRSELYSLSVGGEHVLTAFTNGTFSVWDTYKLTESPHYPIPGSNLVQEAISPDATVAAFAFRKGGATLALWDMAKNHARWTKTFAPQVSPGRLAFSADGALLAFPCWPWLHVFEVASGAEIHTSSYKETYPADIAGGTVFTPDKRRVALANYSGWTLVWDLGRNEPMKKHFTQGSILASAALSPDAQTLFVGGFGFSALDLNSGRISRPFNPPPVNVNAVAVSADGQTLAVAEGSIITLWSLQSFHLVGRLRGHLQEITALAFRKDDALVSASYDQIRVWPTISKTTATNEP